MRKQKGNTASASAGGIAGWLVSKGHLRATQTALPALASLRGVYARYKAFRRKQQQAVAWQGEAVSVDEIVRNDARMPRFNFTGTPGALQWWPDRFRF